MKESHFPPTALFVNLTDEPALYVKPVKSSSFLSVFKLEKNQQNSNVQSIHDPVVVMKFEFLGDSARLLRKLDHFLLWILSIFKVEFYTLFFI